MSTFNVWGRDRQGHFVFTQVYFDRDRQMQGRGLGKESASGNFRNKAIRRKMVFAKLPKLPVARPKVPKIDAQLSLFLSFPLPPFLSLSLSRWLKFSSKLKSNMAKLLDSSDKSSVQDLGSDVLRQMSAEFEHIDPDYFSPRRGRDVCRDFWACMMFRPDMAGEVREKLRIQLSTAAAILQEAIEAAGWPEDFW